MAERARGARSAGCARSRRGEPGPGPSAASERGTEAAMHHKETTGAGPRRMPGRGGVREGQGDGGNMEGKRGGSFEGESVREE